MRSALAAVMVLAVSPGCLAWWAVKSGDKDPKPAPPVQQGSWLSSGAGTPYAIAEWDLSVDIAPRFVMKTKDGSVGFGGGGTGMLVHVAKVDGNLAQMQAIAAEAGAAAADAKAIEAGADPATVQAASTKSSASAKSLQDYTRDELVAGYRERLVSVGITPEAPQGGASLFGHPATTLYGYDPGRGAAALVYVAANASGTCAISVMFSARDRQAVTALAQKALATMKTLSGGAAKPPVCQ